MGQCLALRDQTALTGRNNEKNKIWKQLDLLVTSTIGAGCICWKALKTERLYSLIS